MARRLSGPRPAVYKRRPSSPNPNVPIIRSEAPERSVVNEDLSAIRGKLNPVKELQLLGRQNSNNDEVNDFYEYNTKLLVIMRKKSERQ